MDHRFQYSEMNKKAIPIYMDLFRKMGDAFMSMPTMYRIAMSIELYIYQKYNISTGSTQRLN